MLTFNGWFVGGLPEKLYFSQFNWRWFQFLISGATCVCVNLFIIISGYFGLKFKISSFVHIALLLVGIYIPFYLCSALLWDVFSIKGLLWNFFFVTRAGYFVQCYLMLIFFSPVLNAFVRHNSRKSVMIWVLLFWFIEFWFGCVQDVEDFGFKRGYSIIHFVLVYMISRLVALYNAELKRVPQALWWCGYAACSLILALMYALGIRWDYANPVNIISSFCLFMPFLYYSFQSQKINWIAKHTFAVYIIQVTNPAFFLLTKFDIYMLAHYSYGKYLLSVAVAIIVFFAACIIYDHIRDLLMSPAEKFLGKKLGRIYQQPLFVNL